MSVVSTKRFTVDEYHRLIELGFLTDRDRIELIRGELVKMAAKGTLHSVCTGKLRRQLDRVLGDRAVIRGQEPVSLPLDSEPEPDVVVAFRQDDDYLAHHPYPDNIAVVIEVSDSTLNFDQTTQLQVYAENAVPHYWIVNLVAHRLEQYSQPYRDQAGEYGYRQLVIALRDETVPIPGFDAVSLDLALIFPRPSQLAQRQQ